MAGSWNVEFEIQDGVETPMRARATGEDSFQALDLAVQQIAIVLGPFEEHGKITCNGHPGHGFTKSDTYLGVPIHADSKQRHADDPDDES
jgi:hypothetical protein